MVTRPDGFKFRVTVTLPQDYQKGTRLPAHVLVLPARVPGSGVVRPARPHVQQEQLPELRVRSMEFFVRMATRSSSPTRRSSGPPGR